MILLFSCLPRYETSGELERCSIKEEGLFDKYVKVGENLQDLLSIDPVEFAMLSMVVHYCESNINTKAAGKGINKASSQTGIFQITESTRKALNIPELAELSIDDQLKYYECFLRNCNKRYLKQVKNSVDLHKLHFAPSRFNSKVLSVVTNKYLKALDFNNDDVITEEDLLIFQKKRIKNNNQISIFFKMNT